MPALPAAINNSGGGLQLRWSDDKSQDEDYAKVLFLGDPKAGKSTTAIGTSPGPVLVINSDSTSGVKPVKTRYPGQKFATVEVYDRKKMEEVLVIARKAAKNGEFKTIVWDNLSLFAQGLESEVQKENPDGRAYWRAYTKYLVDCCSRLKHMPAHIIVTSHYIDTKGAEVGDDPLPKTGHGIVPLLSGKARVLVPAVFDDVLFLKRAPGSNKRVISTSETGVFGPGGRNTKDAVEIEADMKEFFKLAGVKGFKGLEKSVKILKSDGGTK